MRNFIEAVATDAVIERMAQSKDPRFLQVISSVIRHLHGIVRDVEPTVDEWFRAIQFLTAQHYHTMVKQRLANDRDAVRRQLASRINPNNLGAQRRTRWAYFYLR